MLETRNFTNQAAVPMTDQGKEDSNASRKTSPGRSTHKQHWRNYSHAKRDKSNSVSPTHAAGGLVVTVVDPGSLDHSPPKQEQQQQQQQQPVAETWAKKQHRKKGSHHNYYVRGNRSTKKDSPRNNMVLDQCQDVLVSSNTHPMAVQTEARNDLLISAEPATSHLLHEFPSSSSSSSCLRVQTDMKISRRDSPASPECSSIHSPSDDDDSNLDFEFGLENISFPSPDRTSQSLTTVALEPKASSIGCFSGDDLSSTQYPTDPVRQDTVVSYGEDTLAQAFQDQVRLLDSKQANTTSQDRVVVTTNAAGAAILDTLAARTNMTYYNHGGLTQGRPQESFGAGHTPIVTLDTNIKVEDSRIDANSYMYSMAPPFVQMPPMPGYWNPQTMPSSESNPMFMPPPLSYPLAYGPVPTGYGPYMMPPLLPSSPYYMNNAATNHTSNPWPLYPPQTPVKYEQVSVGGTVFFTPVYSSPPMEPPMETTTTLSSTPATEMSESEKNDPSTSQTLPLPTDNTQVHANNTNPKKKKKYNKKRGGADRKEHDSKHQ